MGIIPCQPLQLICIELMHLMIVLTTYFHNLQATYQNSYKHWYDIEICKAIHYASISLSEFRYISGSNYF